MRIYTSTCIAVTHSYNGGNYPDGGYRTHSCLLDNHSSLKPSKPPSVAKNSSKTPIFSGSGNSYSQGVRIHTSPCILLTVGMNLLTHRQ